VREVRPTVPDVGDHVHDGAAVRLHPLRIDLAHDDEATGQIVAHHGLKTLGADGFQRCPELATRVVEQPVDASVFGKDRVNDVADPGFIADVCGMDGYPTAVGLDLGLHGFEFVGVAADDRHVSAQRGQFVGGASPDSAGSTGDYDRATGEKGVGEN
jgi:hypothetical protein